MEQSPSSETDSCSADQDIPRLIWNPEVHYRVHKSPQLISILGQMHSVHTFRTCYPKIHSDIILPSTPRSPKWFSNNYLVRICHLSHVCYMPPISSLRASFEVPHYAFFSSLLPLPPFSVQIFFMNACISVLRH
jgi:hypothetical protein